MAGDASQETDEMGPGVGIVLADVRVGCAWWIAIGIAILAYLAPFGEKAASITWNVFWVWAAVTFYHGMRRIIGNSVLVPPKTQPITDPVAVRLDYVDLPTSVPIPAPSDVAHAQKRLEKARDLHRPRKRWLNRTAPIGRIASLLGLLLENAVSPVQLLERLRRLRVPRIGRSEQTAREQDNDRLLLMVMERARTACRHGGHPLPDDVTFGTVEAPLPNAFAENWFGAAPLVGTTVSLHLLCHLLAKAIAPLIAAKTLGRDGLVFGSRAPSRFPRRTGFGAFYWR